MSQQSHLDRTQQQDVLLKRLEKLADARWSLLRQFGEVETQIRAVQREYNSLHNLNAPITVFPDELLAMVFEAGAHIGANPPSQFGMLVSRICQRWRTVALATPWLWRIIRWRRPYTRREIERVAALLLRSKSVPIEVYIDHFTMSLGDIPSDLLKLTRDHMEHCCHISIWNADTDYFKTAIETLFCHPVPMLKSIEFGYSRGSGLEPLNLSTNIFPFGAPSLNTAHLSAIYSSSLTFCQSAFQRITSLRLTCFSIGNEDEEAVTFIKSITALPFLNLLELEQLQNAASLGRHDVFLHTIKFLRIRTVNPSDLEIVINSIYAARLTTLDLPGTHYEKMRPYRDEHWGFHFPFLQHLILDGSGPSPLMEGAIGWAFTTIKHLTCRLKQWEANKYGIGRLLDSISLAVNCSKESQHALPWPELDTIAVSYLDEHALQLYQKLSKLQNAGHHIRRLKLPKSFLLTQPIEDIGRLRSIVELEEYNLDWPNITFR